jgi:CUE domain
MSTTEVMSFTDFRLRAKAVEQRPSVRTKQQQTQDDEDVARLVHLFPDIDSDYARMCLQSYTYDRVAAMTEKLIDRNFSNYPKHVRFGLAGLKVEFQDFM